MTELILPRPLTVPDRWKLFGLLLMASIIIVMKGPTAIDVGTPALESNWEGQDPSNCSDALGSFDAFIPGMRGHGSCNRGGFVENTTVYVVTNTNASGSGSLANAVSQGCPKVILFGVSGRINVSSPMQTNNCDDWSIVGASAPGNITLTGGNANGLLQVEGSNFTIDHMTIAAATGAQSNNDSIQWVGNTAARSRSDGIVLNNNFIWGGDETVQCYPQIVAGASNILYWQNIIGIPVGGSGVHIIQNSCTFNNSIRNFYIHANGRHPLIRGDGYFHANNFHANPGYETVQIRPCTGAFSPIDSPIRIQVVNNFMVRGPNSSSQDLTSVISTTGCTTLQVVEENNREMNDNNTINNCDSHACTAGLSGLFVSSLSATYPTGYVPESIANTAAGLLAFAEKITDHVGARPISRLSYIQTQINEGINMVDGSGDEGGWSPPSFPVSQPTTTVAAEGGVGVITPSSSSYDPTDGAENPCSTDMPTGAAANAIQGSGLTGLHEWVIECFYDNVMPAGYREAL